MKAMHGNILSLMDVAGNKVNKTMDGTCWLGTGTEWEKKNDYAGFTAI